MSQIPENCSVDPETFSREQCRQPTIRTCEECSVSYCYWCGVQDHWRKCKNYETWSEDCAFSLRAARDLMPGEVILEELPLVFAPRLPFEDGLVPCVGCCRSIRTDNRFQCPECLWPACKPDCEELKNVAAHGLECEILKSQNPSLHNFRFEILLPLRILLLRRANELGWENLIPRIEKAQCSDSTNDDVVEYLQEHFCAPEEGTTKDLIQRVLNFAKSVPGYNNAQTLYATSGLIQHSCTPNSVQTLNQFEMTTRANSKIPKNAPITASYTDLFQATYDRRSLQKCCCSRCQDPTEFGTFFSALKCMGTRTQPCTGTQLPANPTSEQTLWLCDKCNIELPNDEMVKFLTHLKREVDKRLSQEPTVEELEEMLSKLLMFLHQNHAYVCRVKLALVRKYTGEDTKVQLCQSLIEILRKLYPNGGLLLAQVSHELFQAKFLTLSEDEKSEILRDVGGILEEMKANVEGSFDAEFRLTLESDEEKFNSWLNTRNTQM